MTREGGELHCQGGDYAGMLSVEMPDSDGLFLERSNRSKSCADSFAASKARSRTQTLGRLLSAEGLDLGLPGVYRSKGDSDVLSMQKADCGHWRFRGALFCPLTETGRRRPMSMVVGDSAGIFLDMSVSDITLSAIPPKKPPRTKLGQRNKSTEIKEQDSSDQRGNSVGCMPVAEPNFGACSDHASDKKTVGPADGIKWKYSPIYKEEQKPAETLCERKDIGEIFDHSKWSGQLSSERSSKFVRGLSKKKEKRPSREQLKASMSVPFDFRKVAGGKMPETQPIDLLRPHWRKEQEYTAEREADLPDLPPRRHRHGQDDSALLSAPEIRGPDILSHLNAREFQNQPLVPEKYLTMMPRGRVSTFGGFKKASWFSRHLPHRKRNKDLLSEPLLWNQVEPFDQGLLVRKDSHGSTEDETMENSNHLDVKDKKKKEKEKKKDKKGKPPSRHGSDAKQTDKVRSKLKKFIGKRPTMESLQERGLIKETVFGCPLDKLCKKEGCHVPKFVQMCVKEVERRGLKIDGIYRVSGNLSHVQKLRYMIDREIDVDFTAPEWEDVHVITGALKMFLRELPEPVIPFDFFDKFIATCKISDKHSRHDATKKLIRALPEPNKETLKYLMQHFCKVVHQSDANRMQVQNIAIVFGPTLLLKPPEITNHYDPSGGNMAVYMMYQNQIIDYMLTEFKVLF